MNKNTLLYVRALLVLAALVGFMYLYGRAMIESTFFPTTPVYNEAYIYIATTLAGLVGGVAATNLSQSNLDGSGMRGRVNLFGRVLAPFRPENMQNVLAVTYIVVYILYGILAAIIWVSANETGQVLEMIRNLALIFIGMVLATAQNFFGIQDVRFTRGPSAAKNVKTARKKR